MLQGLSSKPFRLNGLKPFHHKELLKVDKIPETEVMELTSQPPISIPSFYQKQL